jgi:tetratricopeptide (TPR) repeat protein
LHTELRIRQILKSPSSLADKIHVLVEEAQQATDFEDLRYFFNFLYNSGHHQELAGLTAGLLERRARVCWGLLIELLSLPSLELPSSVIQSLEKGIRRQEALSEIWAVESFDGYLPEFKTAREKLGRDFAHSAGKRRTELLEKFEFLRSQRLDEEAKQVLRTLQTAFPDDSEVNQLLAQFEEHRAREVLTDFAHTVEETKTYRPRFAPEEIEFLETLSERMAEEAEKNETPAFREEAGFFFMFLEDYESALEMLELREDPLSFSEIWFKAELLRMARRFVEALDLVDRIAALYPTDSETLVATLYFRAEVFGDMGKYQEAAELLESIAKVRPHYRSATYLLQSYKDKGFY